MQKEIFFVYSCSMDTFAQLQTTVQSDLNVDSTSTLFPLATIKLALNRAYRKAGGLFLWPETEDAKKTSTVSAQEYYDYPQNWRPNSIWKLKVDNEDYGDPLVFRDYLYEQENDNPSGLTLIWTNQWRRFFIDPVPTTNGNNNIEIWGQKVVDALSADADTTIFSYSMPECNDAIVLEAEAILRAKGEDENTAAFKSAEAKQILSIAWGKIAKANAKYEKTTPRFNVPDFFGRRRNHPENNIGNF